ncbi:HAD family hydrolase [Staphylococcus auricularis]|uniref:HAD family hydrolase n=1 Tax=Staphylococcus auricularis TaxID=29379 RepID=UPI00242FE4C1|nr:HAD family hydrolase [Staphylococcus auricularis]
MFRNMVFDFDGTIADSKTCSVIATQKAFVDFGLEEPSEQIIEYYMGIPIEKSFGLMSTTPLNESELDSLIHIFRENYKEVETTYLDIYKGVYDALQSLHEKAKLFVVSSKKTDVLKRNLTTLNVDSFFLEVIGSDKVENHKPAPDGLLYILDKYQLQKNETVYVGDAIFDIQMAKNANVKSCAVTWGSHSTEALEQEAPDFLISKVSELNNL